MNERNDAQLETISKPKQAERAPFGTVVVVVQLEKGRGRGDAGRGDCAWR